MLRHIMQFMLLFSYTELPLFLDFSMLLFGEKWGQDFLNNTAR
jgi:hypothetical protein